jgi:hypothetical protein
MAISSVAPAPPDYVALTQHYRILQHGIVLFDPAYCGGPVVPPLNRCALAVGVGFR